MVEGQQARVAVNAADYMATLAYARIGDTPWPREPVQARQDHVIAAGATILGNPSWLVADHYLPVQVPGSTTVFARDVDSAPMLDVLRDTIVGFGAVPAFAPNAAALQNQVADAAPVVDNQPASWRPKFLNAPNIGKLGSSGTPYRTTRADGNLPALPCQVIAAEPGPQFTNNMSDYATQVATQGPNGGPVVQARRAPGVGLPHQQWGFTTYADTQVQAQALVDAWVEALHEPRTITRLTVILTDATLNNVYQATVANDTSAQNHNHAYDAVRQAMSVLRHGAGTVGFPVDADTHADGTLVMHMQESAKIEWHPLGWVVELLLSPQESYVAASSPGFSPNRPSPPKVS